MGTLVSVTWFFSALRTSPPNYRRKMKIVILLFAVLATVNAAALQNAKAADESAAVKKADLPKPAKVEDVPEAEEAEDLEEEEDMEQSQEDGGEDPWYWPRCFEKGTCRWRGK